MAFRPIMPMPILRESRAADGRYERPISLFSPSSDKIQYFVVTASTGICDIKIEKIRGVNLSLSHDSIRFRFLEPRFDSESIFDSKRFSIQNRFLIQNDFRFKIDFQ